MQGPVVGRPSRAEYQARRRAQSVTLYFRSPEDFLRHRDMAVDAGYLVRTPEGEYRGNFNAYLLQMIANGTSGSIYPPAYVAGLEKELERRTGWLEAARDENVSLRDEIRTLRQQREALLALVTEADPDAAARFLNQNAQGARA